ncbi:hypothetical protein [Pseudomonas sp. 5P_5.1_Bac1]|uniref:hypothetical protein n=1 Tax=Pseudomonas sp. 5P_5.1_Bac1 TaxID=2971616 RepID=UPI0021C979EB|nr:hypothetical protein [Pseudomonas sp. 5P_5.1_Bac1]MCU1722964.1 hypothetical protein [Pseudomonas sp. 5P_5.1_Bac1]
MSFFQNRALWIAVLVFSPFLLLGVDYGVRVLTSVYKKDLGNGVVIYGDDYVRSGLWVFDCKYSRAISRERLPAPLAELSVLETLTFGQMYYFNGRDVASAKEAITAITAVPEWHKDLQYIYSGVGATSGDIVSHKFFVLADHAGVKWAVEVSESLRLSGSARFVLTGRPYNPETYVDHTKAIEAAVKSCPAPQQGL